MGLGAPSKLELSSTPFGHEEAHGGDKGREAFLGLFEHNEKTIDLPPSVG